MCIRDSYADEPGFSFSATVAQVKEADYALTPGRYVGTPESEDDGEPIDGKVQRLAAGLVAALDESARMDAIVRQQLARL